MTTETLFLNRELSWLEFNQRVLDEAFNPAVPVLDRLFFLGVTASNLDEFFMVRVGGLDLLIESDVTTPDNAGLSPREQRRRILARVGRMVEDQYRCWHDLILRDAAASGVRLLRPPDYDDAQQAYVQRFVRETASAVLTPVALPLGQTSTLASGGLYLAALLTPAAPDGDPRLAVIRLTPHLRRVLPLPAEGGEFAATLLEDAVQAFLPLFFEGQTVSAAGCFRITRNADIPVREEYAEDLAAAMETLLRQRRSGDCVRLELAADMPSPLRARIIAQVDVALDAVFEIPGPLDLSGVAALASVDGLESLRYPSWPPQACAMLDSHSSLFDEIADHDVLLSLPFERFDPVVRLVQEAAADPAVLAIKIILYRAGERSAIVEALIAAAEAAKSVTAVVELKARFDEANNIAWAREMEAAGVQVIQGVKGLKTHAKACMVVRVEDGALVRYLHLATGNYNAGTARFYTDVGLLSCDPALGADLSAFFHAITGYSTPRGYQKLAQAPLTLRERLLELIGGETQRARSGQPARIAAKLNALVDPALVRALYEASQAGVTVDLNIRGICVLRPGVPGLSERIRVLSIVDRFLEHSRILRFHHGGDERLFLSSADWMPRNLDRRIELLTPVEDPACRERLIQILDSCLSDTAKGREMMPDGSYRPPAGGPGAARSQEVLYRAACETSRQRSKKRTTLFEPHRPARRTPGEGRAR